MNPWKEEAYKRQFAIVKYLKMYRQGQSLEEEDIEALEELIEDLEEEL